MLPSTGYFKGINCPFYENGTCDRPYCHFKHSKREDGGFTAESAEAVENRSPGQVQECKASTMVAERLEPALTSGSRSGTLDDAASEATENRADVSASTNTPVPCVYNPTPIAELKKRHIPIVSYMPTRETRIAVKRKCSPDQVKPWLSTGNKGLEPPTSEIKYKPTTIVGPEARDIVHSYVPTCKSDSALSNLGKVGITNDYLLKLREVYYPKSKKRREEYVPKNVKAPLKKNSDGLSEPTLDNYGTDFDKVDEVLVQDGKPISDLRSGEVSQNSCLDLEGKFSDDDDEDNSNSRDSMENVRVMNTTLAKRQSVEQPEYRPASKESDRTSDGQRADIHIPAIDGNNSYNKEGKRNELLPLSGNARKEEILANREASKMLARADKDSHEYAKKHKNQERSKTKDRKEQDSSRKHKDKHNSDEKKSRSSSRHRSKSRSHSRHESKETRDRKPDKHSSKSKDQEKHRDKDKGREKERQRDKEKDKSESRHKLKKSSREDPHGSSKRRENDSRSASKKQEHVKSKIVDASKRSKADNTPDGKKKSSASTAESIRSSLEEDDDDENDDPRHSIVDNDMDIDVAFSTSDSDHDVQEECLKIFQEYQVPERTKVGETSKDSLHEKEQEKEKEGNEEIGRKRVAHPSAAACVTRQIGVNQKSRKIINPQQKMYERWRMMREAASEKVALAGGGISKDVRRTCLETTGPTTGNSEPRLNGNGRIRIAHVPYAKSLAIEKIKVAESVSKVSETKAEENCKTAAQTSKGGVRVAHVPQTVPQLIRPEPLHVSTQKFPLNVRQYYVNMMHDVCVLIYTNAEDAAQRAVKEEYACHERCKALAVYKNSCMLAAHRLRKEIDQNSSAENNAGQTPGNSIVSHEAVLAGKAKGTWSVLKTKRSVTDFRGAALYGMLKKWIMTEQQLRDNGFPRPHPDGQKGRAKMYVTNMRKWSLLSIVPNERICSRCGESYMVDKNGFAVKAQNCIYHWGRKFTIRGEGKYSCCQQYGSATGCCDAKTHVWDYTDYENLRGYVKTLPKDMPVEEQGVYALDCEMCYTTQGLELTRVTVIDEDCSVVYETLVKPQNPIIDYNTRFSGITEECMKDVTTTLLDVQATLLTMFSGRTILVGHSLESDFKALKLLHDTVVDTSVMFPHKNGHPQKRALKNLSSEYLRKIIQNDVGGHDSKEDAVTCMELILWKVKEEAKLQ